MNKSQLAVRQKANNELGLWIQNQINGLKTKGHTEDQAFKQYQSKIDGWYDEQAELDRAKERLEIGEKFMTTMHVNPGDLGTQPNVTYQLGSKSLGKQAYPFGFPKNEVKAAYEAVKRGGNYIIETKDTFSSIDSLLVPQQAPGILPEQFEARLIDNLPVTAISAPSYQFLQHNYADDTGGPDFVAEGTAKPQWNPAGAKVIVTAQKLAVYFNQSSESMMDAPQWESYLINTAYRKIMTKENTAILYGTVTDELGIQGWSTQAGVLTHDASGDGGSATNLDSLEIAINQLRVQSGVFATPNLAILSPTTWSATRRIKSTTNEYIAGDPLHEAVMSVWGIPVVTSTAVHDGDCFLVDTSKFGSVLVREGLSMHMGYSGTGLIENILTTVTEERIALATVIPSAINYVTNLDVS